MAPLTHRPSTAAADPQAGWQCFMGNGLGCSQGAQGPPSAWRQQPESSGSLGSCILDLKALMLPSFVLREGKLPSAGGRPLNLTTWTGNLLVERVCPLSHRTVSPER